MVAHEIGHIILRRIYNGEYSHVHKFTSTSGANQKPHPHLATASDPAALKSIEKDVMKYYFETSETSIPSTGIASENDVRGLIALASLVVAADDTTKIKPLNPTEKK